MYLQTEGKLAGCWVMKIEDEDAAAPDAENRDLQGQLTRDRGFGEEEDREKVIVRSNGTVTYVGKDIAYQFWKFGLLGRDFHYRPFGTRPERQHAVDHVGETTERVNASAVRACGCPPTTSSMSASRICRSC